jgi:hypothetical protein
MQSVHVPDLPAEIQSSQLWTPTTFFWLNILQPYFGESLRYVNIILRKFAPFLRFASQKKLKIWIFLSLRIKNQVYYNSNHPTYSSSSWFLALRPKMPLPKGFKFFWVHDPGLMKYNVCTCTSSSSSYQNVQI